MVEEVGVQAISLRSTPPTTMPAGARPSGQHRLRSRRRESADSVRASPLAARSAFLGLIWPARVWCRSWPPRWRGAHPSGSRSSAPWRRRAGSSRAAGARRGQMRHPASPGRRRSGAGGRSVSPCSRGGGGAHARVFAHYRLDLAEFDSTPRILTCRSVRPSNLNWPFGHQPFIDAVARTGVGGLHVGSGQVAQVAAAGGFG